MRKLFMVFVVMMVACVFTGCSHDSQELQYKKQSQKRFFKSMQKATGKITTALIVGTRFKKLLAMAKKLKVHKSHH